MQPLVFQHRESGQEPRAEQQESPHLRLLPLLRPALLLPRLPRLLLDVVSWRSFVTESSFQSREQASLSLQLWFLLRSVSSWAVGTM